MKKNKALKYGNIEIPENILTDENVRVSISIKIPGDVLFKIREIAASKGLAYQTYINKLLRDHVVASGDEDSGEYIVSGPGFKILADTQDKAVEIAKTMTERRNFADMSGLSKRVATLEKRLSAAPKKKGRAG